MMERRHPQETLPMMAEPEQSIKTLARYAIANPSVLESLRLALLNPDPKHEDYVVPEIMGFNPRSEDLFYTELRKLRSDEKSGNQAS